MGSEGSCPPPCIKLLICSGCGGYGLIIQDEAQKVWVHEGNTLSNDFTARQNARCQSLRLLINAIFARLGHPLSDKVTLKALGTDLVVISKHRGCSDEDNRYCIERADQCESIIDENETDYLDEIHYVANP